MSRARQPSLPRDPDEQAEDLDGREKALASSYSLSCYLELVTIDGAAGPQRLGAVSGQLVRNSR